MVNLKSHTRIEKLMGNRFEICVVTDNEANASLWLELAIAKIRRIEKLLTTFSEDSQTQTINRNAGLVPVKIDKEVYDLIYRSLKISQLTQGAFDISYGGLDKSLWNFDTQMKSLPSEEQALEMISKIDYRKIILNPEKFEVFLSEKGMRIGFGGIGKGYAADQAKKLLQNVGATAGYVNASGDLIAWGTQPGGKPWTIGLTDPNNNSRTLARLPICDMAIATSGNYEKFTIIDGKRFSHTIDPRTGLPVSGIKSVSIICPMAELADALATPVTVMGVKSGLNLINQLSQVEAIIIDDQDRLYTSNGIHLD